jgi:Tfp pilus assembly protein PilN
LQAKFPKQAVDNSLSEQLQTSQQLYQSLSQIVELLSDDQSDQAKGYSQFLTALAEHTNRDVWLTRINIDSTTQDIRLHGSTFKSDQIPALLQHLQNSKAFKGRHFARLTIQENPDNPALTDFNVSSSLKPDPKTDNANQ